MTKRRTRRHRAAFALMALAAASACKPTEKTEAKPAPKELASAQRPAPHSGEPMPRPAPPPPASDGIEPPNGASKYLGMSRDALEKAGLEKDGYKYRAGNASFTCDDLQNFVVGIVVEVDDAAFQTLTGKWGPATPIGDAGDGERNAWFGKTFTAISTKVGKTYEVSFTLPIDKSFWGEKAVPPLGLAALATGTPRDKIKPYLSLSENPVRTAQGFEVTASLYRSEEVNFLELKHPLYSREFLAKQLTSVWGPPQTTGRVQTWINVEARFQAELSSSDSGSKLRFVAYAPLATFLAPSGSTSIVAESRRLLALPSSAFDETDGKPAQEKKVAVLPSATLASYDPVRATRREVTREDDKVKWVTYEFDTGRADDTIASSLAAIETAWGPKRESAQLLAWAPGKDFKNTAEDFTGSSVYRVGGMLTAVKKTGGGIVVRVKRE